MAFQTVGDTAEAIIRYSMNTQVCTLTFYGKYSGNYTQANLDDLAEAMDGWAGTYFKPIISSQGVYLSTNVRGLEFFNDQESFNDTNSGVGGLAGQPLSNALAFAVKRRSAFTGRSARGRVYMPLNISHLAADEDFVLQTEADDIVANLDEVRAEMLLKGWTEVIVSRYTAGALRAVGVTYPVVAYQWTDLGVDTQRRRAPFK